MMTNEKNNIVLKSNSNGEEFPLEVEDLIPLHSSSSKTNEMIGEPSSEDFDRAVALIWSALMDSSEDKSGEKHFNSTENWEPKQVSDA